MELCPRDTNCIRIERDPFFTSQGELLDFTLPPALNATEPPESRGLRRDQVRLMVSNHETDLIEHGRRFVAIIDYLVAGDVLVLNVSRTRPAAATALASDGREVEVRFSTAFPHAGAIWVVEVRDPNAGPTRWDITPGTSLALPEGATVQLHLPYSPNGALGSQSARCRLWIATVQLPEGESLDTYLGRHGLPIRYAHVPRPWPLDAYQTVYGTEVGSAEMPSAGRAFTSELLMTIMAKGVLVLPLVLHCGVASLEADESPFPEEFRVPPSTARAINSARQGGSRVVAVGTTVVRALETVTDQNGVVYSGAGWTDLIIDPGYRIRAVDALLTTFHEPKASHLSMLRAFAGLPHLENCYRQAVEQRYLFHEFGDLHLLT